MEIDKILNEYNFSYLEGLKKDLENKNIVVFGSGILGKKVASCLLEKKIKIVAFADNNEKLWGTTYKNIPVLDPAKAANNFKDAIFIVSVWNPLYPFYKVQNQLIKLGISYLIHSAHIMQIFSSELLPHYHFETPKFYFENRDAIIKVFNLMSDSESKRQYLNQFLYRLKIDFNLLPEADFKNQYFPNDIITLSSDEVFVDAGAFDGDTYLEFEKRVHGKYKKYIALEPDPKNYKLLTQNLSNKSDMIIDPFAVGSGHYFLNFNSTGGEGASINDDGDIEVECISLDEKYYNEHPTFLKFDIEGAELDALIGAKKIIEDFSPTIAVCIYHKPQDIFEIPLWILSVNKKYKFYVRTHGDDGFEFVLYAISLNN